MTVLYNLANEPWLKYSMAGIADQGLRSSQWTSARLRSQTLFLETARERFQLSYQPLGPDEERGQVGRRRRRRRAGLPPRRQNPPPAGPLPVLRHAAAAPRTRPACALLPPPPPLTRLPAHPPLPKDLYQLARCRSPLPVASMRALGVPMPAGEVEVLQSDVAWDEFKVGSGGRGGGKAWPMLTWLFGMEPTA